MAERMGEADRDIVQSLARGLALVRVFDAAHPALTLDEAAACSGFSRSATRRLLRTLMAAGLARFDGRFFRLAPGLLDLGYAQQSILGLADVARPHAESLSRATGRTVSVARLEGDEVVYVLRVGTPRFMHVGLAVGSRLPAHVPAIGRVIIAARGEAWLADYLASASWRDNASRLIRTEAELRRELADVAERGWCLVSEELDAGLRAIAVPLRDRSGEVVAALNMSTRTDGRPDSLPLEDLLPRLRQAAEAISADLHARHLA
ncbi:MAG TPA: IclR family transcriptional regulator C-terminal domain-containing protein [Nocardioides sp.]|nr:IclR family transcriptional regulator C-terminal domain-containing protein [Nocardioides sp.]